jgi:hypothetical protein
VERAGEIIEASTGEFVAQCYELYHLPPLGSLVKSGDLPVYGLVYQATTASIEPGRRPLARGQDEVSEAAVYHRNPQLSRLLRSEFRALAVGYGAGDDLRHSLPPVPALIHGFVYLCSPEEVGDFSRSFAFLNILLQSRLPLDAGELIIACLRQMGAVQEDPHAFLVSAGKELALLLRGNFNQLRAILRGIKV